MRHREEGEIDGAAGKKRILLSVTEAQSIVVARQAPGLRS